MQKLFKGAVILGLTTLVVACAQPQEEVVVVEPAPVVVEQPTGKF
ncbi:MAG: hypothetical protein AAGF30_16325 [Pseudomonadota bacterium]